MNKKLFDIIVCGPAVGKTFLSKIDSRFIDLDQMKAKYKYDIKNEEDFEKNTRKILIVNSQIKIIKLSKIKR